MALFSTAYWAPRSYYRLAEQASLVQIEQYERYQKQSYRNRCVILSANGPLVLTVPILRPHACVIRDARIDYSKPWRQIHRRAIEAAYRSSAYFQEYSGEIGTIYQSNTPFLFDLNIKIWELSQTLLGVSFPWALTHQCTSLTDNTDDYRAAIHPKAKRKPDVLALDPYFQIFNNKFGFFPDLSILDLIFNEGTLR